jgi:hypothetical protein
LAVSAVDSRNALPVLSLVKATKGDGGPVILVFAVIAGLVAGQVRAWIGNRPLNPPQLRLAWLVPVALIPQILAFYWPPTRLVPDGLAAIALVSSQVALLCFVWSNRGQSLFWLLGIGLGTNLLVILANGGLMPISPETIRQLAPDLPPESWQIGSRLGSTKDIVLPAADTRLWWLSDRFRTPAWFPYPFAFSLGDMLIALGASWLLWKAGGPVQPCRDATCTRKQVN